MANFLHNMSQNGGWRYGSMILNPIAGLLGAGIAAAVGDDDPWGTGSQAATAGLMSGIVAAGGYAAAPAFAGAAGALGGAAGGSGALAGTAGGGLVAGGGGVLGGAGPVALGAGGSGAIGLGAGGAGAGGLGATYSLAGTAGLGSTGAGVGLGTSTQAPTMSLMDYYDKYQKFSKGLNQSSGQEQEADPFQLQDNRAILERLVQAYFQDSATPQRFTNFGGWRDYPITSGY